MSRLTRIQRGKTSLPPRLVVYGTEGIGKSTFACSAPSPIVIQTEDGLGQIEADKFPVAARLEDVQADLIELETQEHEYQTLVLDSLDWLERLIWDYVCRSQKKEDISQFGYGQGYTLALKYWRELLEQMDRLRATKGIAVILVAHSKIERYEDPEAPAYDRYSPRLHKLAAGVISEWCDALLFATRRIRVSEEQGRGGVRHLAATTKSGEERVLRCVGGPACMAKNRFGLPNEIPLSWESFVSAIGG